jgi:hypothetical protein
MSYTKGPLEVSGAYGHLICKKYEDGPKYVIAEILSKRHGILSEEEKGTARLFAAAPDLLEACKAVAEHDKSGGRWMSFDEIVAICRAAIAKAEPVITKAEAGGVGP